MPCQRHSLCNSNKFIGFSKLNFSKIAYFSFNGTILGWVDICSLHSRKNLILQQLLRNDTPSVFLWLLKSIHTYPHITMHLYKHERTIFPLSTFKRTQLIFAKWYIKSLLILFAALYPCSFYTPRHMMSPIYVKSTVRNLKNILLGTFAISSRLMTCFNKTYLHIHFL